MEKVKVRIKGTTPMLVHRFSIKNQDEAARRDQQYDIKEDTERALYRNGSRCYVPSTWIEACLRDASKNFRGKGRSSMKSTILSSVFVTPEEIPLGKETYDEIDIRPVVIQRNRIVRARPRFNTWEIGFEIEFDDTKIKRETLRQILEEAGRSTGIGDFRPKFGRFELDMFE
jgi:hypothetical protein